MRPTTKIEDRGRVDLELRAAAPAAVVFAVNHNHPLAGVDEPLWLDPVLIPYLVAFRLKAL